MRMKGVRSLREMTRLFNADLRLRRLCLIKLGEADYPRSVLSRFICKVGENNLIKIIEEKVVKLLKRNDEKDADSVFDASFIRPGAREIHWITRKAILTWKLGLEEQADPLDSAGKLHLAIDSQTMLPLTCTFASANQNEQKHSLNMVEKTKLILKQSAAKLRSVIADSQYSDSKLREIVDEAVIPYPANQKRGVRDILRVDRKFRTYGQMTRKRSTIKGRI